MSVINIDKREVPVKARNKRIYPSGNNSASVYVSTSSGGTGTSGVSTFNTRNGDVTLTKDDVETALTGNISTHSHTETYIGTVTYVGLVMPNIFNVTNSPITSSGNLTTTLVSQTQNKVLAAPADEYGTPSFRLLDVDDIPDLSAFYASLNSQSANKVLASPSTGSGTPTYRLLNIYDIPNLGTLYQTKPVFVRTSSNKTTTSTSLTNIGDLTASLEANGIYEVEVNLSVDSSDYTGCKYGMSYSGTATIEANINGASTDTVAKSLRFNSFATAYGSYLTSTGEQSTSGGIVIKGIITASSAGTLNIQQLKNTSGTATVYKDSFLKVYRIGTVGGGS